MNRRVDQILAAVRVFFLFLNRTIESILRRLKETQEGLTETVRDNLPERAQVKLAVVQRVVAKGIDMLLIVLVAVFVWYPIGPFLAIFYSLFADGINRFGLQGQSLGKAILGLRVLRTSDNRPARWKESALRNLPGVVATFFAIIPIWGWVIFVLVGIPLAAIEVFLMFRLENENRLGDVMADTRVVDITRESRKKV
ncbi:MAG: RDD family protein [Bdellovibrionales bacterium]|nr:RDD family protein [Bdellovibrionales bacterium]